MNIVLKNVIGEVLTQEQAKVEDDLYEEHYIEGKLKMINEYDKGTLCGITYYLSEGELLDEIVQSFKDKVIVGYYFTIGTAYGDYTLKDLEIYRGLVKVAQGKSVFDNLGREIAHQAINIDDQRIIYTEKTCYLTNVGKFIDSGDFGDFGTLQFTYDQRFSGDITVLVKLPGFELKQYYITPTQHILLHPMISPLFSWEKEIYYHNATPLVPGQPF